MISAQLLTKLNSQTHDLADLQGSAKTGQSPLGAELFSLTDTDLASLTPLQLGRALAYQQALLSGINVLFITWGNGSAYVGGHLMGKTWLKGPTTLGTTLNAQFTARMQRHPEWVALGQNQFVQWWPASSDPFKTFVALGALAVGAMALTGQFAASPLFGGAAPAAPTATTATTAAGSAPAATTASATTVATPTVTATAAPTVTATAGTAAGAIPAVAPTVAAAAPATTAAATSAAATGASGLSTTSLASMGATAASTVGSLSGVATPAATAATSATSAAGYASLTDQIVNSALAVGGTVATTGAAALFGPSKPAGPALQSVPAATATTTAPKSLIPLIAIAIVGIIAAIKFA